MKRPTKVAIAVAVAAVATTTVLAWWSYRGGGPAAPRRWMAAATGRGVTFNKDVAPIVHQNCSACHRPGEAGPFPLLSYDDVRRRAKQVVDVTTNRVMPPWLQIGRAHV